MRVVSDSGGSSGSTKGSSASRHLVNERKPSSFGVNAASKIVDARSTACLTRSSAVSLGMSAASSKRNDGHFSARDVRAWSFKPGNASARNRLAGSGRNGHGQTLAPSPGQVRRLTPGDGRRLLGCLQGCGGAAERRPEGGSAAAASGGSGAVHFFT